MGLKSRVTNLSVKREGNVIKASWKNPGEYKNVKCMDIRTWFDRAGVKLTDVDIWYSNRGSEKALTYTASDRFWAKGYERASSLPTSFDKNYDRNRFHPVAAGKTLSKVQVGVAGYSNGFAPWTWATYTFGLPRKPTISWDYKKETSVATVTVETNEGKDAYERYDTMIMVKIRKQDGKEAVLMNWSATKSTKWTKSWDLSGYTTNLQSGQWVSIRCWAYARGIAGDNPASNKPVYGERNIVFPVASTPGTVTCDKKAPTGRIKVPVTRNGWWVTDQLQRKIGDGSWSDVSGATDNHEKGTISLYDSYGDVMPENGVYTYYRVKTTRDQFTSYSGQVTAKCIYTAKPAETCSATCKLASLASNAAGTQVTVVMAWKDSTANTGCELSWSEYSNGWNTSEQPTVQQVTGADGTSKLSGWTTRTYSVSGLTSGTTYYFRMRRYKEYASGTKYSAYDISGKATAVKTESADDDRCGIAEVAVNGTTATVTIGINEDNVNTGTEITWATHEDAWQSNEQPESFNAEWARSAYGQEGWTYKQVIYLRGLEAGRTYYAKARRYLTSGGNTTYSTYSKVKPFTIPSGAAEKDYDVRCGLLDVQPGEDGQSAKVVIGWSGDHTGCEVTWSDNPDAWESSDGPSSFDFEWSDDERQSEDWAYTSTCYITGLTEGVTYYVKARSYFDGDPKTYSSYSDDLIVTPYSAPESVALEAPSAVARGKAIECWWEISGDLPQVEWHMHDASNPLRAIAEGTGTLCHASIDPERYGDADSISIYVEAGCGGGLTRSNTATVGIADKPECEAYCANLLTSQPSTYEVLTNDAGARLLATCYSRGVTLSAPDGDFDQIDGDAVWTQSSTPSWESVQWSDTDLYAALSANVTAAQGVVDDAETAFEATEEYAAMESADDDLADAETALEGAQSDLATAQAALTSAEEALASAEETLAEAQAVLDELEPGDPGYDDALAAVEAAEAAVDSAEDDVTAAQGDVEDAEDALEAAEGDYRDALAAYLAAYDAAYATTEGIALQDANAALDAATEALDAHADDDTLYSATVTMPTSELLDGGNYYTEFRTVENVAGLVSDTATVEFGVSYAHQAPEPSSAITVTPDAENRKVVINLASPTGAAGTDVYDVYRQTPYGYELVAYGKGLTDEVTDLYAPYGKSNTAYRIACRTVDGDIAWTDFDYSMPVQVLRFDWDENSVELPWNIEIRESLSKDYENRRHVDGSMNGYWDRGVQFSGSYSTDIIKVEDAELLRQVREVGSYPGAVWVRDGHGKAMQCNVDVNEASISYRSKAVGLSFSFTSMKTTEQFMMMGVEEEPEQEQQNG